MDVVKSANNGRQCSHFFKKVKARTKCTFPQHIECFFLEWREFRFCDWLRANKSHLIGCLPVGAVQIHSPTSPVACPTSICHVSPSCLFVMSVRHVCPSCLSITSVRHVCPSCLSVTLSITSVRHICLSRLSVTSVHHVYPSRLSITSVRHICPSRLSNKIKAWDLKILKFLHSS